MRKVKKIYQTDPWLEPYKAAIEARHERILKARDKIVPREASSLSEGVNNHLYYGLHKDSDGSWVIREWAPNATRIYLIGEFNNWKRTSAYEFKVAGAGNWELRLDEMFLSHGELYKLFIEWPFAPRSGIRRNHIHGSMTRS